MIIFMGSIRAEGILCFHLLSPVVWGISASTRLFDDDDDDDHDNDDENAWITKVTRLKVKDKLIVWKIRGTTVDWQSIPLLGWSHSSWWLYGS